MLNFPLFICLYLDCELVLGVGSEVVDHGVEVGCVPEAVLGPVSLDRDHARVPAI